MNQEKITFKNSHGKNIVGLITDHGKDFILVHCHGYGANKESKTAESLMLEADKNNISFLRFDFYGFGESDGKQKDVTMSSAIDDLKSVIIDLGNKGFKGFGLSGSSFGGGVVLNYLTQDQKIKSAALKAPVSDYSDITTDETDGTDRADDFLLDASKYTIYDKVSKIKCPVLIIHGDSDECVPIDQSQKTCGLIENCKLIVVKGGNHKLSDHRDLFSKEFIQFFKENK